MVDESRARLIRELVEVIREELEDHEQEEVRLTFADVPDARWLQIEGEVTRRWPTGDVKRIRLAPGILVEWERGQE